MIYAIDRDHSAKASTNAVLNASRSAGLRLVINVQPRSLLATTGSSCQCPPAFRISVFRLGQLVRVLPATRPASIKVHGP